MECDLHERYGVDVDTVGDSRSWRWLRTRILGLLSVDSRLYRGMNPPKPAKGKAPGPGAADSSEF